MHTDQLLGTDPLAIGCEPTDAELAEVMADVARVAGEKRAAAAELAKGRFAAEVRAAEARAAYLRKQFNVPRL